MQKKEIIKLLSKYKTSKSFIKNLCGQRVGSGAFRDVYIFKPDHRFVVKVERDMMGDSLFEESEAQFANVTEWRNWTNYKDWVKVGPWMAPCLTISENGHILIQRRAVRLIDNPNLVYHNKVPAVFADRKKENFGFIGKKFVCVDYSFLLHNEPKLRRVNWYSADDR